MKSVTNLSSLKIGVVVVTTIAVAAMVFVSASSSAGDPPIPSVSSKPAMGPLAGLRFTAGGELLRPTGYRKWVYVGTPVTPHDMNDGQAAFPEFHSVYINPKAYDHFEATGEFPDGTVLIKELVSVGSKRASSGKGYFMGDFIGLEVSVKDKQRYSDEPGSWAFFSFGHEYPLLETAKVQPAVNCNACHGGAADDDYVFTQYYPVLGSLKKD